MTNKIKKYANFIGELAKLAIQIKDDYYIMGKQLRKIILYFSRKSGWERRWMVSLMQNEGKTDNKKTMISFSSDDFSAPSDSRICEFRL